LTVVFTDAVISNVGEGQEINLLGFGSFYSKKVAARNIRNPRTGATMLIAAFNQPKFRAGQKLKDACNVK